MTVLAPVMLGKPLRFEVMNRSPRSVFTEDQKSGCSILVLERARGAGWEPLRGCNLERKAAVVELGPGETRAGEINPWSTHFERPPGSPDPAIGPGRYRLRFSYRLARLPEGEEPNAVVSAPFEIGT